MNIQDSKERLITLIDNVNKQDFSEQKEENLEEDIKFINSKLGFGEEAITAFKNKTALVKYEKKEEPKPKQIVQ